MTIRQTSAFSLALVIALGSSALGQQKGQWLPGQSGLNAGLLPEPGFTYLNLTVNYSAGSLRDADGNSVPVQGDYNIWAIENWLSFVPSRRILGGHYIFLAMLPGANGSLTVPHFGLNAGGYGYADTMIEPAGIGWHFNRVDTYAAYGFVAPTGRYHPGATDNVGSGYWGHHFITGSTFYLTKDKKTTANLLTDLEIHGKKSGTNVSPGQAFTTEWGLGQLFPLDKQYRKLLQLGVVGYDQWQVTANSGTLAGDIPARLTPFYSVHAIGLQANFMLPAQNLSFTFKYEPEYRARAHTMGTTISFGGSWTFRMPKAQPQP